jgi:hypothetical protein
MGLLSKMRGVFGGGASKEPEAPLEIKRNDDPSMVSSVLSNQQRAEQMQAGAAGAGRWGSVVRGAKDIEQAGVLEEFAKYDTSALEKKDENVRTLDDDAMLVRKGFSAYNPEQIAEMKEKAFADEKTEKKLGTVNKDWKKENDAGRKAATQGSALLFSVGDSDDKQHYGSELHKEYGATVEYLSGGLISAEEAMAMNPTGGIAGPGDKGFAFQEDNALRRHAIRHDAVGFLMTRFGVGPGYGTKTGSDILDPTNPLAGQHGGIIREMKGASDKVDAKDVGKSARFAKGTQDTKAKLTSV